MQQMLVYVQYEARRVPRRAVKVAALRLRYVKLLLRPRHGHEGKPPLLLHSLPGGSLPRREYSLVHAAEKHVREFKALCGMHRHELYLVPRLRRVAVCKERYIFKVAFYSGFLAAGSLKLVYRLLQFRKVVEPLLASLCAQHLLIPALIQYAGEHLGYRPVLRRCSKAFYQRTEGSGLCTLEYLVVQTALHGLIQRTALLFRDLLQEVHAPPAYVALGSVGDAQEGKVVLVGYHSEVAQGVLYLRPVEELHPAVYHVRQLLL